MIDDLRAMAIFVETVKQGSFRKASLSLALSPSVVSYQVSHLEKRVGNALLYRSTRKLSLTSEGETLFAYAERMLAEAAMGLESVSATRSEPTGALSLTVPTSLTRGPLAERLVSFREAYPEVSITVTYTDHRQDLIEDGIDLAIRVGTLEDSNLMSRHIGDFERKLVCSPAYYGSKPSPTRPEDLCSWHWIKHGMLPNRRRLVKGSEAIDVTYESKFSVNSVDAITQLSILGQGVSTPPVLFVEDALESGKLIEILPDWQVEPIPIYAVWPNNVSTASNTRRLLDHLVT